MLKRARHDRLLIAFYRKIYRKKRHVYVAQREAKSSTGQIVFVLPTLKVRKLTKLLPVVYTSRSPSNPPLPPNPHLPLVETQRAMH